ncbi:MAG: phage head closure protein, partial [Terriglobales bacterium]
IQQRSSSQDSFGQPQNIWSTFAQVYARVRSVSGSEQFSGQQYAPEVTHQVTIRYVAGVTPMQRIVTPDNKILEILTVNPGERQLDDVVITCKERIGASGDENVG